MFLFFFFFLSPLSVALELGLVRQGFFYITITITPCYYYYYSYSTDYCRYYMFKLPKHPLSLNHDIGVGQLAIAGIRRDGASHKKRRRHGLVFSC